MPDSPDMLRYTPPRRLKLVGTIAAAAAVLIVVVGILTRVTASREVDKWTDANALPTVSVIDLDATGKAGNLSLPGNIQAFNSAPIYARVSGYLKKWYVDIGTKVKAGQLLAEIDIPDQDQQLAQARADLGTAIANRTLSAQTAKRWNALAKESAAAPQDVDEKNADLAAKTAAVASAKANVDRLADLSNFKRITAPFDGTVTSRAVDVGALVTVGAPGSTPLFTVADTSKVARLRQRAAELFGADKARHGGHLHGPRISGPHLQCDACGNGRLGRRANGIGPDPAPGRQRGWGLERRRLRPGGSSIFRRAATRAVFRPVLSSSPTAARPWRLSGATTASR